MLKMDVMSVLTVVGSRCTPTPRVWAAAPVVGAICRVYNGQPRSRIVTTEEIR